LALLTDGGSDAVYHREEGGVPCPCRTPEGFRDPQWHIDNPTEPVCNEAGMLPGVVTNLAVKAFVQPATVGMRTLRSAERIQEMFGEVQRDDHFGVFPCVWNGTTLDFNDWSLVGDDYVLYDNRRFIVVASDKIADVDGDPNHHWEVALRNVKVERPL
jgi:hypothetical protein